MSDGLPLEAPTTIRSTTHEAAALALDALSRSFWSMAHQAEPEAAALLSLSSAACERAVGLVYSGAIARVVELTAAGAAEPCVYCGKPLTFPHRCSSAPAPSSPAQEPAAQPAMPPKPTKAKAKRPDAYCVSPALYASLYAKLREAAHEKGYALGIHGSLARDLDVIAIPWTDEAEGADALRDALMAVMGKDLSPETANWRVKPHGRRACSIVETGGNQYLDLSVMPRSLTVAALPELKPQDVLESHEGVTHVSWAAYERGLAALEQSRRDVERLKERNEWLREGLRSIAKMDPGDGARMSLWASDTLSGYTLPQRQTQAQLQDALAAEKARADAAEARLAEIEAQHCNEIGAARLESYRGGLNDQTGGRYWNDVQQAGSDGYQRGFEDGKAEARPVPAGSEREAEAVETIIVRRVGKAGGSLDYSRNIGAMMNALLGPDTEATLRVTKVKP